jgi:hypothetical protein
MNDPNKPFTDCFSQRQPQTPTEIEHAINAIYASEMCALRYGGTDPEIIQKLHERRCGSQCDYPLATSGDLPPADTVVPYFSSVYKGEWNGIPIKVEVRLIPRLLWTTASIDVYIGGECILPSGGQLKATGSCRGTFVQSGETHQVELSWGVGVLGSFPFILRIDGVTISESRVRVENWLYGLMLPLFVLALVISIRFLVQALEIWRAKKGHP